MKHADLFNELEQHGIAILKTRMPGWDTVWYALPRPRGLRYVGTVNRRPPLPKPNRRSPNWWPSPLVRTIHEMLWFAEGVMDRSEIMDVHPDYAAVLGAELVTLGSRESKEGPLRHAA